MKSHFLLRPEITFLNFGSFGATPSPVFEKYQQLQRELEAEPVRFITVHGPELLRQSRVALGEFVGAHEDDLIFVPNPTYAINLVALNLELRPGDEILSTGLEYGAMDRTWDFYCKKQHAKYIRQHISLPLTSKEQFIAEFWKGYSAKTKAIFISQITSSTALIFPVKEICAEARKRGLIIIVDGAHVPGHIPLNIAELEVDYYTGACHKWMMTPKGSSFLYVRRELQEKLDPLIVSWGYNPAFPSHSRFLDYHQFNGTRDFTAYLAIPAAIEYARNHNTELVKQQCRDLVKSNIPRFCELLETEPLAPVSDEFFGQMASFRIKTDNPAALNLKLYNDFSIEVPVMPHGDATYLRYSVASFTTQEDLDKLYDALKKLKRGAGF